MGYALIWIESLASVLLLVALVTALSARWSRSLYRWVLPVALAVALIAVSAFLTLGIGWLRFKRGMEIGWFSYILLWTLALAGGILVLYGRGLRRRKGETNPAARAWPISKLMVATGASVLLTWITFSNMDLAVKMQLSALRAEAGAKMLADMPPRVFDRDNAALVYQEAFAALAPVPEVPERWRDNEIPRRWRGNFNVDDLKFDPKDQGLLAFLARQERGLALLRKAAAMPACRFEHDYFAGEDRPEFQNFRQGVTLLAVDALHRASQGDSKRAGADLAAIYGIARHINEPFFFSFLSAAATEKFAGQVLEELLSVAPLRTEDLAGLLLDDQVSYRRLLHRCWLMDEASGISVYTLLAAGDSSHPWLGGEKGEPILESGIYRVFFLQDDLAGYRRAMKQLQPLANRPYYEAVKGLQEFGHTVGKQPPGIIASLILPAADRIAAAAAEADAARDLARLALAMTAYHQKNAKYPDKLDELVPQYMARIPLDPFDGRPVRMKRNGQEVVLYSIGLDLKDDGGAAWDRTKGEGDIVFRLRRR